MITKLNKSIQHFWQTFLHHRVFIFILTGTSIIFLTFFTDNNTLEIAISGIASVFIGIGVNNFSSFETHEKDERKMRVKIAHSVKVIELIKSKISKLNKELNSSNHEKIITEFTELQEFINLSIQMIKEEDTL